MNVQPEPFPDPFRWLKRKYRERPGVKQTGNRSAGNSGTPVHSAGASLPVGIRRRPKGKTRYK